MIVYMLVALVCNASACVPMQPSNPVDFKTEAACVAFAQEAAKQGASYACVRQTAL